LQGCHNGRFWMKITVERPFRSDIRLRPHLPYGRHPASVQTQSAVRADAGAKKKYIFFFLVVVAVLKKEKKISVFGFQSPRSPRSPSSAGFASEVARRRRFFWPSSPSHPSKLYSSLGLLNSKVPKPFPPFSLRLIDIDGF
jgi:hypothetical protein